MRQNEIRSLNRESYFKFSGKFEIRGLILRPYFKLGGSHHGLTAFRKLQAAQHWCE